ncbi:LysM peptidoglycan-binding domain-containing protein [Agriterribacter sp.]|uniref:muramidase family protein n=1 Tax=Agriterribacter sp. TaxID=2821509 RepID=UPI002D06ABCF|nr:LysM peptidoglycan-binding domain-containing protein [Agriterribacter sp.]HRO45221.1 LysM peptidoglycan-binding domain-containing protein [Agriterribacter sp.]HRQ16824.1 LysM peptidoglycan-binding domain-containing protein [Agriterribacter sp.]
MKKLVIVLLSFGIALALKAQPADLIIQSENSKLFINHTVEPKENLYSIGRLYNISPKEIAPFNGLSLNSGLEIDQELKIPLQVTNFTQHGTAAADEVFVPLYHIVAQKEGLYRIGQNFNKVSVSDLKTWNNLSSETISNGQALVVGFLRVKTNQSALAAKGIKRIGGNVAHTPAVAPPATTRPVEEPVVKAVETAQNTALQSDTEGAGFFKNSYREQAGSFNAFKREMGEAAVFKSTSGWQDAKYYALMNNITPGTIVRITNANNKRIIFAKVLGELPPGRENEGLLIRISNAAAAELKISDKDPKFSAEVAYAKDGR